MRANAAAAMSSKAAVPYAHNNEPLVYAKALAEIEKMEAQLAAAARAELAGEPPAVAVLYVNDASHTLVRPKAGAVFLFRRAAAQNLQHFLNYLRNDRYNWQTIGLKQNKEKTLVLQHDYVRPPGTARSNKFQRKLFYRNEPDPLIFLASHVCLYSSK